MLLESELLVKIKAEIPPERFRQQFSAAFSTAKPESGWVRALAREREVLGLRVLDDPTPGL